jgi:3,4-dihydroxy 2-butanone 4-phosphate synthase
MAQMIRDGSGIVCLCLTEELADHLRTSTYGFSNSSQFHTAFTVTIEAAQGVTTGVSAKDRVTTVFAAIKDGAVASDLHRPGHVFPLRARDGGVLTRRGHTEGTIDLARLAGLKPAGVLCEANQPRWFYGIRYSSVSVCANTSLDSDYIEELVQYR